MKLTFRNQMYLGMVIIVLCFTLALILQERLLNNAGWVLYGLLWLIHPVFPANVSPKKHGKLFMRLAGAFIVFIGMTAHLG